MVSGPQDDNESSMRYQMIGTDDSTTEEKLAKYSGPASWSDLKAHLTTGTLIYVDPALSLRDVGKAFAEDDQAQVSAWLKSGDLVKPSEPHGAYWESIDASFECQVVSPFVLMQPAATED